MLELIENKVYLTEPHLIKDKWKPNTKCSKKLVIQTKKVTNKLLLSIGKLDWNEIVNVFRHHLLNVCLNWFY